MSPTVYKLEDEHEMLIAIFIASRTDHQNYRHAKQECKANTEMQAREWEWQFACSVTRIKMYIHLHREMSESSKQPSDQH